MQTLVEKKRSLTQYAIGGAIAVVVLFAWISIPLMQNSSTGSSANPNNFFKTRTADLSSLGGEIPLEGGAPGSSLLDISAAVGENMASMLFQSGPPEEGVPADSPADPLAGLQMPGAPDASSPGAAPSPGGSPAAAKAKMAPMPSISAGGANSMTAGGTHDKFFGSGGAAKKDEVLPSAEKKNSQNPGPAAAKRGALVAGLEKMNARSLSAARSFGADQSRDGATSAFEGSVKPQSASLNAAMELASEGAGTGLSAASADLKRNDPSMSSKKITIPEPVVDKDAEADQRMKEMILQMLLSGLMQGIFSQ